VSQTPDASAQPAVVYGAGDLNLDENSGIPETPAPAAPDPAPTPALSTTAQDSPPDETPDPATAPAEQYLAGLYDELERLQDPVQRFLDYLASPPDFLNPQPGGPSALPEAAPSQNFPPRSALLPPPQAAANDYTSAPAQDVVDSLRQNLDATDALFNKMTSLLGLQNQRIEQLSRLVDDLESRIQDALNK
jgi:ABC-type transporter Mla subunit MlaD